MAAPAWIQTAQGDLIPLGPSPLTKISRVGNALVLYHVDGTTTNYPYNSADEAVTALNAYVATTEAKSIGDPEIHAVTPAAVTGLPQNITITGVNFINSTTTVILRNYTTAVPLVTTFNSSTSLTAAVPNTVAVGTYDVIYSDANGGIATQGNGLVVY